MENVFKEWKKKNVWSNFCSCYFCWFIHLCLCLSAARSNEATVYTVWLRERTWQLQNVWVQWLCGVFETCWICLRFMIQAVRCTVSASLHPSRFCLWTLNSSRLKSRTMLYSVWPSEDLFFFSCFFFFFSFSFEWLKSQLLIESFAAFLQLRMQASCGINLRVEVRKTNNFCFSFPISWKWGWNVEGCCCDFFCLKNLN